ncbi:nucleosome assembly protein 1-like 1 [Protopterus annectens]|uniref:nucleosome assembly protein 1-like 1 n=1 Tax=Protopterus annectens TaxID=7888 RepID=UPI001CFC002C|nr:nucleosome assembly protein 1-like 1 [Protopterus annectens]
MADIDNKDQAEDAQEMEDVEEVEEEETGDDTNSKARQLTAQMMQNPQILAALQERLDGLVGNTTGYIESLPKVVKRRINALKNLQVKCAQIEAKFYEEVHELERKYAAQYQPLFDKRNEIINAIYEPTDPECEWKVDEEEQLSEEMKEKAKVEDEKKDEEKEDPKGVPEFWLTVFKNVDLLSDMVQEHDEPILKHLKDIKVKFSDAGQPMVSLILLFKFELDDEAEAILAADFEIGHFLRERIVPRAVLYFTGEAIEDDDDDYDEEGEEADDEEGEEEADEENDPEYDPKKDQNPPAECKQQ